MAVEKETAKNEIGKGKPGPGRPKGVPNRTTTAIKDMVIAALDGAGGVKYLKEQAKANPSAFLTLVGKIIPTQITGDAENPVAFADVTQDAERVALLLAQLAGRSTEQRPSLQ
jgi:hypothetical protein